MGVHTGDSMCRLTAGGCPHGAEGAALTGAGRPQRDRKCHPAHVDAHTGDRRCRPAGGRPRVGQNVALSAGGRPHGHKELTPLRIGGRGGTFYTREVLRKKIRRAAFSEIFCTFSGSWIRPRLGRPHRLKVPSLLLPSGGAVAEG